MVHFMTERTLVLIVHVVPCTLKLMVVILHAFRAVFHFRWVIARFTINSPFHEGVDVPGGHGAVPIRTICPTGCPTLPSVGIVTRRLRPVRGFRLWSVGRPLSASVS